MHTINSQFEDQVSIKKQHFGKNIYIFWTHLAQKKQQRCELEHKLVEVCKLPVQLCETDSNIQRKKSQPIIHILKLDDKKSFFFRKKKF